MSHRVHRDSTRLIGLAAVANAAQVLRENLLSSPDLSLNRVPVEVEWHPASATIGLERAIERVQSRVVICAHQDVYLPKGWLSRLEEVVRSLEYRRVRWGVLGVVGVTACWQIVGRAYSVGLGFEVGTKIVDPCSVVSLDELVLIINRDSPARLDAALPGFHLYGTDLVQESLVRGWSAFVIDNPVIHNSVRIVSIPKGYPEAYRYMRRKWHHRLPIPTTVIPITRWAWPLLHWRVRSFVGSLMGRTYTNKRYPSPGRLAGRLGYS